MVPHSVISALGKCGCTKISLIWPLLTHLTNENCRSKEMMKALVAKFPDGYEGWAKENEETPVERSYTKM
jgi:hypothetical protein